MHFGSSEWNDQGLFLTLLITAVLCVPSVILLAYITIVRCQVNIPLARLYRPNHLTLLKPTADSALPPSPPALRSDTKSSMFCLPKNALRKIFRIEQHDLAGDEDVSLLGVVDASTNDRLDVDPLAEIMLFLYRFGAVLFFILPLVSTIWLTPVAGTDDNLRDYSIRKDPSKCRKKGEFTDCTANPYCIWYVNTTTNSSASCEPRSLPGLYDLSVQNIRPDDVGSNVAIIIFSYMYLALFAVCMVIAARNATSYFKKVVKIQSANSLGYRTVLLRGVPPEVLSRSNFRREYLSFSALVDEMSPPPPGGEAPKGPPEYFVTYPNRKCRTDIVVSFSRETILDIISWIVECFLNVVPCAVERRVSTDSLALFRRADTAAGGGSSDLLDTVENFYIRERVPTGYIPAKEKYDRSKEALEEVLVAQLRHEASEKERHQKTIKDTEHLEASPTIPPLMKMKAVSCPPKIEYVPAVEFFEEQMREAGRRLNGVITTASSQRFAGEGASPPDCELNRSYNAMEETMNEFPGNDLDEPLTPSDRAISLRGAVTDPNGAVFVVFRDAICAKQYIDLFNHRFGDGGGRNRHDKAARLAGISQATRYIHSEQSAVLAGPPAEINRTTLGIKRFIGRSAFALLVAALSVLTFVWSIPVALLSSLDSIAALPGVGSDSSKRAVANMSPVGKAILQAWMPVLAVTIFRVVFNIFIRKMLAISGSPNKADTDTWHIKLLFYFFFTISVVLQTAIQGSLSQLSELVNNFSIDTFRMLVLSIVSPQGGYWYASALLGIIGTWLEPVMVGSVLLSWGLASRVTTQAQYDALYQRSAPLFIRDYAGLLVSLAMGALFHTTVPLLSWCVGLSLLMAYFANRGSLLDIYAPPRNPRSQMVTSFDILRFSFRVISLCYYISVLGVTFSFSATRNWVEFGFSVFHDFLALLLLIFIFYESSKWTPDSEVLAARPTDGQESTEFPSDKVSAYASTHTTQRFTLVDVQADLSAVIARAQALALAESRIARYWHHDVLLYSESTDSAFRRKLTSILLYLQPVTLAKLVFVP